MLFSAVDPTEPRRFCYEKCLHDAKAERDQLAEVQQGTKSLQTELKEMNDKFVVLQDDLLAKDALLERSNGKIERLVGKVQFLSVDLDEKKEKI